MSKDAPSPPPAPDPYSVAGADFAYGNFNQNTPYGSTTVTPPNVLRDQYGNPVYTEPGTIDLNLDPKLQENLDRRIGMDTSVLRQGQSMLNMLPYAPQVPASLNMNQLPQAGQALGQGGQYQTTGGAGPGGGFLSDLQGGQGGSGQGGGGFGVPQANFMGVQTPQMDLSGVINQRPNLDLSGVINQRPNLDLSGVINQRPNLDLSGTQDLRPMTQNREAVEQATFKRMQGLMDPVFSRQEDALRQSLANRGLLAGGEAFGSEMGQFGEERSRAYQDAALQSVLAGGQEQSRQFGLSQAANQDALQRAMAGFSAGSQTRAQDAGLLGQQYGADFQTRAQDAGLLGQQYGADFQTRAQDAGLLGQQYGADLSGAQFGLGQMGQQFGADMSSYGAGLGAQQQQFGQQNALRQQAMQEQLQNIGLTQNVRGSAFNEMASLLGLQQVSNPGLQNFIAPSGADATGAFAMNQAAQNNAYNAQMQNRSAGLGGMFGLGASALGSNWFGGLMGF